MRELIGHVAERLMEVEVEQGSGRGVQID